MRVAPRQTGSGRHGAFTMLEMLIAISIFSLVLTAIYSSWTAILRSSKSGLQAAATVQRSRIVVRILEDSLGSAMCFAQNNKYYGFLAEGGNDATLSFVARLSKSFPRSGEFGDFDVRRLIFRVEPGPDSSPRLVLRQCPLLVDLDDDEMASPLVLAKNVKEFKLQFWNSRQQEWVDDWKDTQTNSMPEGIMVTLKLADTGRAQSAQEEVVRIIHLPAKSVAPAWQRGMPGQPGMPGAPGIPGGPGGLPGAPGTLPPGNSGLPPGFITR